MVEKLLGKNVAEQVQLTIQYAPKPPIHSGDPNEASKSVKDEVTRNMNPLVSVTTKAFGEFMRDRAP